MIIKVISLNLWWGGNLLPGILEFLKAEAADVLLLQEVYNGQDPRLKDRYRSVEVLKKALPHQHYDYAQSFIHDDPAGMIPQGNAIFTKFPITGTSKLLMADTEREVFKDVPEDWPVLPRTLQGVSLDVDGRPVNVFNLHGVWDLNGDNDSPARRQMVEAILESTAGKSNVIVAGDTNAKSTNPVWRALEGRLKSVFGGELRTTFNMRRKDNPGYATAAVDLMFVSPDIKVVSKNCPDVDISDHLPIVAELDIAKV